MRDLHQGLKTEVVATAQAQKAGVEFVAVRHQWSKEAFEFSIHAFPSQYSLSGLQTTDLLHLVGFKRGPCAFRNGQECFARNLSKGVAVNNLADALDESFGALESAERSLQACGFPFPNLQGWGYFFGKQGAQRVSMVRDVSRLGDGHAAGTVQVMKSSEDDVLRFVFTWIVTSSGNKGWITHYR